MEVELSDGVVVLDPFRLGDVEAHLDGEDVAAVRWLTGGTASTRESTTAWVERNLEWWRHDGPRRLFAIRDGGTRQLAGMVEANLAADELGLPPRHVNISYQVYPWARGRGWAARGVQLVCAWLARHDLGEVAVVRVEPDNTASLGVPPRAGFDDAGWIVTPDGDRMRCFRRTLTLTT